MVSFLFGEISNNKFDMKQVFTLITFIFCSHILIAQIGIITTGLNQLEDPLQVKSGYGIAPFIPIQIELNKDSTKSNTSIIHFEPGFSFTRFNFKNKLIPSSDGNELSFSQDNNPNNTYNNNLFSSASAFQISSISGRIIYSYRIKSFKLSAGIHGKYIIGGSFLRKFRSNGNKIKTKYKFKDDPEYYYFNRFQYGLLLGASYKWLTIYGSYNLSTLIEEGKGPTLRMYHFGVFLNFFWKKMGLSHSNLFG